MDRVFPLSASSGVRVVTNAGQRITLPGGAGEQLRVYNVGPNAACGLSGTGTQTAAMPTNVSTSNGAGIVFAPGVIEVFSIPFGHSDLHLICAATETATIYFSRGDGN